VEVGSLMCAWGAASANRLLESPPPLPSAAPPSTGSPSNSPPPPTRLPFFRRSRGRRSTPTLHTITESVAHLLLPLLAILRDVGRGCVGLTVRVGPAGESGARREWDADRDAWGVRGGRERCGSVAGSSLRRTLSRGVTRLLSLCVLSRYPL
jgi:hypothetical protein